MQEGVRQLREMLTVTEETFDQVHDPIPPNRRPTYRPTDPLAHPRSIVTLDSLPNATLTLHHYPPSLPSITLHYPLSPPLLSITTITLHPSVTTLQYRC